MEKMSSIVDIINHYQKSIDRSLNDEARLVHCIGKLYRLPVSVQHLQETGIGRTVNGLRKYDGEVGVAAKALVSKWKNMVAAEESDTGEPEPQHLNHEEDGEDNYDESCLQVDEDRHSDDHQEEEVEDENEEEQHHQEEESDNQEEMQTPQQVNNDHDSDHQSIPSSHHDSDRHRSGSRSSSKGDRNSHHNSSSSKDGSRSHDRHEKHRDGEKNQHHSSSSNSSSSSSSKGHSSSPSSSKKSSKHEKDRKDKKDKHSSSRKDSSQANEKESSHSSSKEKTSSSDKHHSRSKESLNGFTNEDESNKRKRTSEDEEESAVKKVKNDQPSESKSKSKSKSSSNSSKDRSSSKSSSSSVSSKEKDKNRSSEKKKESSSKPKKDQPSDNLDEEDEDNSGGASFADALAMIGMPSTSKKKSSTKGSVDKIKASSSSMPPPAAKSEKHRSSSSSRSSSSKRSASPNSTASSSGYSSCSSTPSLLTQKPKMAPLPIAEIVESLPMISPNYRPMPLNQTVMECVFSNNGKPQKRPMTEEEALGHSMQSKNLRTKVYSGVKNYNGEVPTLYNLCIRLLQEHIDLIDYTGGIPFDLLKPVLERASPDQLFTLENYNPYLMEDSDVLWEQHCKRNFRSQKRKEEECESWREMFIRCSEERETKLLSLTANIKQSQVAKAAPIRKTQLAYVDSAVKPPRNIISKQARYGTAQAPVVSPAARVASLKNATSNVAKVGDSRLKVAAGIRDTAQVQVFQPMKPKKAPLMSKVMQSIKGFKGFRR